LGQPAHALPSPQKTWPALNLSKTPIWP
jgi:hypothetical protein